MTSITHLEKAFSQDYSAEKKNEKDKKKQIRKA